MHYQEEALTYLLIPLLLVQTILILIGSALWVTGNHVLFILFLTLSMGLQNGVVAHFEKIVVHSTYITGMTTTLLKSLGGNCSSDERELQLIIISELVFYHWCMFRMFSYFQFCYKGLS
ncbi:DUF1275 domain-containing protein [Escherichia coli]|nr:DUF1275 domain-containing protein [Escherichia coli]EFH6939171.1 DUF1275 domain-containing protein [Escherichia coli]EFJ0002020.1 DUF1275 domain-containing protein [Escherichia coli]EFN2288777.1 DUF1275 domain-containing protein [Escherichia coli]ELO5254492.1 DUF1275 family protein [Escherichia coli]